MRRLVFLMVVFLAVMSLAGCGGKGEQIEVAKNFWNALQERDIDKARSYATKESGKSLTMNDEDNDTEVEVSFGKVELKDGRARVETTLHTENDDSSVDIPMETVLVKEEGQWKVDVNLTMMSMFGGAMGAMMESMKEGMEKMGEAVSDGMKKAFEDTDE